MIPIFAFGSNLDRAQMRARCPSARFLDRATLPDHTLAFVGHSARWGGAVATVRRKAGAEVLGALYAMSTLDRRRLDGFEGGYRRERRRIVPRSGAPHFAELYVLDRALKATPSDAYLDAIARGYAALGYSMKPLLAFRGLR